MIIGLTHRSYPTVHIPPYDITDDPTAIIHSSFSVNHHSNAVSPNALSTLQRYFPSNMNTSPEMDDYDIPMDAFTCDHFRIYVFKVKRCARARSHDWTECPYAHPGEKARRRDPRKFRYSGTACSEYKKGECVRGDACEYAHGVFECWLHPTRYRTQPCKDGVLCHRKICFFAHTADQLRLLPTGDVSPSRLSGSPSQLGIDSLMHKTFGLSPTSTLYSLQNESPPMSSCGSTGFNSVSELSESMRGLYIGEGGRMSMSPSSRGGVQMGFGSGSPRQCSLIRPGISSLPVTPTRNITRSGLSVFDLWEQSCDQEELAMERVESGRDVRAKMYAKLSKENSLDRVDSVGSGYNVGRVSELVK